MAAQRQREEQFRKVPDAARLKEYMEAMAGEPHVAGQPSSKKVADYALAKFKSLGLDAQHRRVRGDDAVADSSARRAGGADEVRRC